MILLLLIDIKSYKILFTKFLKFIVHFSYTSIQTIKIILWMVSQQHEYN